MKVNLNLFNTLYLMINSCTASYTSGDDIILFVFRKQLREAPHLTGVWCLSTELLVHANSLPMAPYQWWRMDTQCACSAVSSYREKDMNTQHVRSRDHPYTSCHRRQNFHHTILQLKCYCDTNKLIEERVIFDHAENILSVKITKIAGASFIHVNCQKTTQSQWSQQFTAKVIWHFRENMALTGDAIQHIIWAWTCRQVTMWK